MSLPTLIAAVLALSITAYAIFAGADFGGGILDLLTGARGADREAIASTIGPVWEANHVWLIFSLTLLFSAFPPAFSALGTALPAPLTVALLAIVIRSAALALRAEAGERPPSRLLMSRVFGLASLIAPFAFGLIAGGLAEAATARPTGIARGRPSVPWTGPFAVIVGALAVALCGYLAASYVALRLARADQHEHAERFRRRGLQCGICLLVLGLGAPATAAAAAPALWHRLTGVALPAVGIGLVAIVASLGALARRRYRLARGTILLSCAAVLWGWFTAQSPRLIGPGMTIHTAAATHSALIAIGVAAAIVLLLVLPAMYLLFTVFARPVLEVAE